MASPPQPAPPAPAAAELVPIPFGVLVTRLLRELEAGQGVYDLPARSFVSALPGRDLSVSIHGHRAATPFGPAAGPHTQLAQNLVLSWLAGGRILELKTVQVKDDLVIPRPCIDMETVGYNVEWSQELRVEQSLEEYVKGSMLIEILEAAGVATGLSGTVLDMSVGYDLAGIRSEKVGRFLEGMKDASALVERLRRQIPAPFARYRDLPFRTRLSDTLTLSTFHGCPPEEIEAICAWLLERAGLQVVVKLNPTLLGKAELRATLRDRLGYQALAVPDRAFDQDASWAQVEGFVGRLGEQAARLGRGFGVKFTNTLVVENHRAFFPAAERLMYLSGQPLHVLAIQLVRRFRRVFADRFPISFSAGIDAANFADAAALGLGPISACTDLLRAGGYGRARRYFADLGARMEKAGAPDLDTFALTAFGRAEAALAAAGLPAERAQACRQALAAGGDLRAAAGDRFGAWVSAVRLANTEVYADRVLDDPRYAQARNATPPRKVGSRLTLFDCLTCDKCIPVCPNDANFALDVPLGDLRVERLLPGPTGFVAEAGGVVAVGKPHQIANLADACNECGHCDVMCPEDGGPYLVKPRFFGSLATFERAHGRDGFALERRGGGVAIHGRIDGRVVVLEGAAPWVRYRGQGFDLELDPADPAGTARGRADGPVDVTWLRILSRLREAVLASGASTWVGAGLLAEG